MRYLQHSCSGFARHADTRSLCGKLSDVTSSRPKARCSSTAFARIEIEASNEVEANTSPKESTKRTKLVLVLEIFAYSYWAF